LSESSSISSHELSRLFPQLKEDLGLTYLQEQLSALGVESVITEYNDNKGLTFRVYDKCSEIEQIKMEWFPTRSINSSTVTWYKQDYEFRVGVYVAELPKVDEDYSVEIADSEFFTYLEVAGKSVVEILSGVLEFVSYKYGLVLALTPLN
jgi:hypothetical protein